MKAPVEPQQTAATGERHVPVMCSEALGALTLKPGSVYVDGTFGAGGYTRQILDSFPDTRVIAFDRDPDAIRDGQAMVQEYAGRLVLHQMRFAQMAELDLPLVDGVVLDIGVSSMQFDQFLRGFSFRFDGPLDMRMGQEGRSAADIVNEESEERLADILYHYGEERQSRPLSRAIVAARKDGLITSTKQLSDIITKILWVKQGEIHPATRTFQALRIAVNDELGELATALHAAESILKPGGVLAVVSFHSLEDRIVKQFFAGRSGKSGGSRYMPVTVTAATFATPGKWPHVPQADEIAYNPRARSAKLRAGTRLDGPAAAVDADVMALARLPEQSLPLRRKPLSAKNVPAKNATDSRSVSKPSSRRR